MELNRVFSTNLDSKKRWYALSNSLCGSQPKIFANNKVFTYFNEEIHKVKRKDLWRENGEVAQPRIFDGGREKEEVYVASMFGICAGLLRQREFVPNGFVQSPFFQKIVDAVNSVDVPTCCEDEVKEDSNFLTPKSSKIKKLQLQIDFLKAEASNFLTPPSSLSSKKRKSFHEINDLAQDNSLGPIIKKRCISSYCGETINSLKDALAPDTLGTIIGYGCLYKTESVRDLLSEELSTALNIVSSKHHSKEGIELLLGKELLSVRDKSIRVPDWVQLMVKLKAKLPDAAWQILLNYLNIGRSGKSSDCQLLLTKNMIKANKELTFSVVRKAIGIEKLPGELTGYGTVLPNVLVWALREARLHQCVDNTLVFNIKLDGRPLFGKEQVSVGLVPVDNKHISSESYESVYPLAIANCKENRKNLKALICKMNEEKRVIKQNGIKVDGILYIIQFIVTVDYKALLLLVEKNDEDEDFELGGQGFDVEFCIFCQAVRACSQHLSCKGIQETCLTCLRSKANIGNWKGIRDDLSFLLEEDLSQIQLCSLHQEMRNTEQLLGCLGFFANAVGCLDHCNKALSQYGPENTRHRNRIEVKLRSGQTTCITKSNIKVSSMSGPTEREVLFNIENIVASSLPSSNVINHYKEVDGSAEDTILSFVRFYESQKMFLESILRSGQYLRDYGVRSEYVDLSETSFLKTFIEKKQEAITAVQKDIEQKYLQSDALTGSKSCGKTKPSKGRRKAQAKPHNDTRKLAMATVAAQLQIQHYLKVFTEWRSIALTIRSKVFGKDEEENIDQHEIRCQLWGRLLRHMFGLTLGSGDYGHLTIDHSGMLFRLHRSFRHFSNQGFEASHKLHRMLYSRATNHDTKGEAQSLEQILTHWFSNKLLDLRYQFRKAKECIDDGKSNFKYRGCGWGNGYPTKDWTIQDKVWIMVLNELFTDLFGSDHLEYTFEKGEGTKVSEQSSPRLQECYDHNIWEEGYEKRKNEVKVSNSPVMNLLNILPSKMDDAGDDSDEDFDSSEENDSINADMEEELDGIDNLTCNGDSLTVVDLALKEEDTDDENICESSDSDDDDTPTAQDTAPAMTEYQTIRPALPLKSNRPFVNTSFGLTRLEMATTLIPNTAMVDDSDVKPVFSNLKVTDPTTLNIRPCASVVSKAEQLTRRKQNNSKKPLGVEIGVVGSFDESGLAVLRHFCTIAKTKGEIIAEIKWLDKVDCISDLERSQIGTELWQNRPTAVIFKKGPKAIDVQSFSCLTMERYIDNMVIDLCIEQFLEQSYSNGHKDTIYLPSEVWQWVSCGNKDFLCQKLESVLSKLEDNKLKQILAPVHMPSHWGLVYVDVEGKALYFDDGLKLVPGQYVMEGFKTILSTVQVLQPSNAELASKFWLKEDRFQRFGMPSQTTQLTKATGIGAGSCGVGVIKSAKDFIDTGPTAQKNFTWTYHTMQKHRLALMLQILKWKDAASPT